MDDIDIKILRILKSDARIPYLAIGKAVNLSTSAVAERVRKLEKKGVISRYAAIIDGKAFEKELTALMHISLGSPIHNDDFQEFVAKQNDILECHYIAGDYDYLLKIITKNPESLEQLLNTIKSQIGVMKTYTNIVLKTIKNDYSVNPE
ncbi:MAG: Leucine-responsive regulatory protein [Firmicutes bacterium ADurb.Bin182]|nr:MAG: Leucine-responsive regulatory protein [Firmicutes bacterium ADurb.Bin182]